MGASRPARVGWPTVPALCVGLFVAACGQSDAPDDAPALPTEVAGVKTAAGALEGANVPTLDPGTLNDAEIRKVVGERPRCTFRYTSSGRPVLVAGRNPDGTFGAGLMKLNGHLVSLEPAPTVETSGSGGFVLGAPPLRLSVKRLDDAPAEQQQAPADMVFEVGQRLKVGYGGFIACGSAPPRPAAKQ